MAYRPDQCEQANQTFVLDGAPRRGQHHLNLLVFLAEASDYLLEAVLDEWGGGSEALGLLLPAIIRAKRSTPVSLRTRALSMRPPLRLPIEAAAHRV